MRLLLALLLAFPQHLDRSPVVAQAKADLERAGVPLQSACGAFAIVKLAAWRMRAEGAGLLVKPAGNNCDGYATDIIAYPDGHIFDVLVGGGETNGPSWQDGGLVDATRYHAALEVLEPGVPAPSPTPAPVPSLDLSGVYAQLALLNVKVDELGRAGGDAHAAINANVTAGRDENKTFFEAVRTEWKGVLAKVAVYAGPIVAALFAGKAVASK